MKHSPLCSRFARIIVAGALGVCFVTSLAASQPVAANQVSGEREGCTIGDAMGNATIDGRPISWKNRDEGGAPVHFVKYVAGSSGTFGILGMGYGNFDLKMGVNDAGLSLQNSLCDNLPGTYSYDDFKLYILSHAGSIADVRQAIITNTTGNPSHTLWASSPAICAGFSDAHGYATLFELEDNVSPYYYEYNPTNPKRLLQFPRQIIARANHAHRRADHTDQLSYSSPGDFERYQTARDDLVDHANRGALDIKNWVQLIARHGEPGVDWMPNNDTTRAAMMVHGVNEGEDARIVTAWLGLGNPDYTIFVPAWAAQKGDLSTRVTSGSSTSIGYVSDRLLGKNDQNSYDQYINGLLGPVEDNIFEAVAAARSHWFSKGFGLDEATRIHKEAAETAWQTMNSMSAGSGRALNAPPKLTAINTSINGLQVIFSLVASDSNGSITAYDWDFGDGTSSTALSPTHSYTSAGTFLVRARVVDNAGARNSKWLYITMSASGATPTSTPTPTKTPTNASTPSNTPTSMPTPTPTNSPTSTPTPSDSQIFADVPVDHPYHDEIEALYRAGYTAGCATNPLRYCPDATMNRGESAVFVERGIHSASYVPPTPSSQVFADLPLDSWAAGWVNGLWADHYTAGCGTNPLVYCPWQGHTRAEGTVFYLRMLNGADFVPPTPVSQTFADVPLDTWYAGWIQAAYDAGLITPCQTSPDLRFCPNDPLSRALAAYMMVQAKHLAVPPPSGLYHSCWPADQGCLDELQVMHDGGFSYTINYSDFDYDIDTILAYASKLESLGMKTFWDLSRSQYAQGSIDPQYIIDRVEAVKNSPATAGYYVGDETNTTASDVEWVSSIVRQADPDPLHLTLFIHFYQIADCMMMARGYAGAHVDALGLDLYPLAHNRPSEDVAVCSKAGQEWDDAQDKDWVVVLQSFKGSDYGLSNDFPTRERMRLERDLALQNSRPVVVFWWWYTSAQETGHWDDLVWAANGD